MSWSLAGGRVWGVASGRPGALLVAIVAAILMTPRPAAAHQVACPELWNPHGQTTPPAGWTTLPGAQGGMNEDHFYQLISCGPGETIVCPPQDTEPGFGGPEFKEPCFCSGGTFEPTIVIDQGNGCLAPESEWFQYPITFAAGTATDPTVIHYIEANGKTQTFKEMGGNNSPNNGNQGSAVDWQLWGQGDFRVCSAVDTDSCSPCCLVPQPPK